MVNKSQTEIYGVISSRFKKAYSTSEKLSWEGAEEILVSVFNDYRRLYPALFSDDGRSIRSRGPGAPKFMMYERSSEAEIPLDTYEEVAKIIGISVHSVKCLFSSGKGKIERMIDNDAVTFFRFPSERKSEISKKILGDLGR